MTLLRFEIADTGIGIAPDELEKIFEPFYQTGNPQHQRQGSGLGLAITRQLIQMMGGELHVASALGQGSAFWFELPLQKVESPDSTRTAQKARSILGIQGTPPTILIVDDVEENLKILTDMLHPIGFALLTATNGQEALRQALAERPALLITDIRMPGMDGLELIRQIRQIPELRNLAIIATSASVYQEDQQQSTLAGSQAFLPKPIHIDKLFDQLQRLLDIAWVYAEEESAAPPLPLIPPPPDAIAALISSVDIGDIFGIRDCLNELEQRDAALKPFIEQARLFATQFQIKELREYLKTWGLPPTE